ncbi:hypothetical protein [Vibrio splendidus]|uniref:hypothetical protein n=1 Tax=Vibrio splendidus TaxID=29497 RepID=UPI001C003FDD|nr:hypothetical protein [Vibrio splendidus]MBT9241055.1 hypothetical protein [Vibrio splendidus]MDP2618528.1 hypothetical protein [Vibrio splendidus]
MAKPKLSRDQKRKKKLQKRKTKVDVANKVPTDIIELSKRQFDAFCFSRHPMARASANEKQWFIGYDRKILATVFMDNTDGDFGYVIMGRDNRKIFRALEVSNNFKSNEDRARNDLLKAMTKYKDDGKNVYPQGDEIKVPNELFVPLVERDKLNPIYIALAEESRLEAARNLIKEIVYTFDDPDGHYIKEFQTHGFDARLWELYLYIYFHDKFVQIKGNAAPDFHITNYVNEYLIEAVTVNPTENGARPDESTPETPEELRKLLNGYMPIKFGSPLYSKLKKKYWEKPHVKGKPLVFAIHDFHSTGSMTWSRTALMEYLYGVRTSIVDGRAIISKIDTHEWKGKSIPSNFFKQPDSENVSAVLFSNAATITKFNRMGKLAGLGGEKVKILRTGMRFNPDPKALVGIPFHEDVDSPTYEESWSESLVMYHNPNALHPVDPNDFPDISHIFKCDETGEEGYFQPYDVLNSHSVVISSEEPIPELEKI